MKEKYSSHLCKAFADTRSASLTPTLLIIIVIGVLATAPMPVLAAVKAVPVVTSDLSSINASITGTMVEVKATIKTITPPHEGSRQPFKVNITDDKSAITLIIWRDVWEPLNKQYSLATGDVVDVRALVTVYGGQAQLTLKDVTDFHVPSKTPAAGDFNAVPGASTSPEQSGVSRISNAPSTAATSSVLSTVNEATNAPAPTAGPTPLSAVSLSMKGQKLLVQASVTEVRTPSSEKAPYRVTLSDGTNKVTLVYWKDLHAAVGEKLRTGNTIRATVTVSDYHNNLQLRLGDGQSVEVVGPPAAK